MAAPAYPPTSACDELVGRPRYHVRTSHAIAPIRPQRSTQSCQCGSIWRISTMSLAIVFATLVPRTAKATKLKNAAHATACNGERTRVETTVAIELAESCQPLA